MSASLARVREGGKEARRARGIGVELGAELLAHVLLLVDSQPRIHHDEEGEHQQRQQRRPLQQKAEKDMCLLIDKINDIQLKVTRLSDTKADKKYIE